MTPWPGLPTFRRGGKESEADALDRARRKAFDELSTDRARRKSMISERHQILVEGTEAELERHDAEAKKLDQRIEDNRARVEELGKRVKEARVIEEKAALPAKISKLPALLEADRKAREAAAATRQALWSGAGEVARILSTHRHAAASRHTIDDDLVYPSEAVADALELVLGEDFKMPREPGPPSGPPIATIGPDGWVIHPHATEEQIAALSREQGGLPAGRAPAGVGADTGPRVQ